MTPDQMIGLFIMAIVFGAIGAFVIRLFLPLLVGGLVVFFFLKACGV